LMLRRHSSNGTQLRLHSYPFLRSRDMHISYRSFPPLLFSCGDIAPIFGDTTSLKRRSDI
jgi:hypothetical protein